nr:hypothetical protein [Tanacetum cinerariifolium]
MELVLEKSQQGSSHEVSVSTEGVEELKRIRESYKQGPKEEEPAPKTLMAIDGIGWDWSYMDNEEEPTPAIGFLRPFGCHVMILNTLDYLGKFDAKGDEGYFVGYSLSSKAFRVFNKRTKKVEENMHVDFLENKLIEKGAGPNWLFDIDTLTNSMNYVPLVVAGTSSTNISAHMETRNSDALDGCNADVLESSGISNPTATSKVPSADQVEPAISLTVKSEIPTVSSPVPTVCLDISPECSSGPRLITKADFSQKETPSLDNALTLSNRFEDTFGVEADLCNMETSILVSPTPTFRIHKDHPKSQIIGPVDTPIQTKHKSNEMEEQSFIATIHQKTNPDLLQFCLFSFDCPKGVRLIGTKWVLKNKKDERGIMIRNKVRLVAQGYTQEERIDYEEVFAPIARIEAIRLFLPYASFMGFIVYQIDVKSAFLYGTIDEEAPRAWYGTLSKYFWIMAFKGELLIRHYSSESTKESFCLSKPDIMFAVCACARHQVTPKECHLHAVKRIFRYLKGHPNLGLWYPKETPFDLVAYQIVIMVTIVATSITEAEYVEADSGCGQVLWIQNQMLDYGIEATNQETKILATVDGKPRTIFESSLRRHLKLNYEEGISSLPDAELFENLSLMGYNILPNQRFTFQKGQFLHQWKFLIHTIMQYLSLKSTGFNEFSSNIDTVMGEGSANPTEPHHTPSPQEHHSPQHDSPPPSPQTIISKPLPLAPTAILTLRRYTKRAKRIAQSKALSPTIDEPASLSRDDRQGEAFPTVSSLDAEQDRGSKQQRIHELMELCTSLQRQQSQMAAKIKDQDLEISRLKIREELGVDKSTELGSNDTEEMVNVLSSMEAANILTSGGAAASVSPGDVLPTVGVPTVSAIFTIASV